MARGSLVRWLQPNLVLAGSVLQLTPALLQKRGLQGLILDVDDTLVPTWTKEVSPEILHWLNQIRSSGKLWLVSNNINQARIQRIAEAMDLPYLHGAGKPSRRKLRQALAAMELPPDRVGMVGDRLFTDVVAGNRLGMYTILVEPILDPTAKSVKAPVRAMEVWFSQIVGASLATSDLGETHR